MMQSFSEDESRELFPLSWLSQYGYCKRRCSRTRRVRNVCGK